MNSDTFEIFVLAGSPDPRTEKRISDPKNKTSELNRTEVLNSNLYELKVNPLHPV